MLHKLTREEWVARARSLIPTEERSAGNKARGQAGAAQSPVTSA